MSGTPTRPDLEVSWTPGASTEQVFSARLDPSVTAGWWGSDGFTTKVRQLDVEAGAGQLLERLGRVAASL